LAAALALAGYVTTKYVKWMLGVSANISLLRQDMEVLKGDQAFLLLEKCKSANCSHLSSRIAIIRMQLGQTGAGSVLFIGDSITEGAVLPQTICGRPTVNAGIGGATVGTFANAAKLIIEEARPSLVVIALGTNDASRDNETPVEVFHRQYENLLEAAMGAGAPVVVATIPPVEAGKPLGNAVFSTEKIAQFSERIRKIGMEKRALLVDFNKILSGPGGLAAKGATTDGVHFSVETYNSWIHDVVAAVESNTAGCDSKLSGWPKGNRKQR
jgi:lysophospholipase L1-like esterase